MDYDRPVPTKAEIVKKGTAEIELEVFRCEPLRCTISRGACAQRHVSTGRSAGQRRNPYPVCRTCEVGAAHAKGERPEVQLVTVQVRRSIKPTPPPAPKIPQKELVDHIRHAEQILAAIDARRAKRKHEAKSDALRACIDCGVRIGPRRLRCERDQGEAERRRARERKRESYARKRLDGPRKNRRGERLRHGDRNLTMTERAAELGITVQTFLQRIYRRGLDGAIEMGGPQR